MKSPLIIIGILLIVFGVGALAYQTIHYNTEEQVAQLGDLKVTANKQEAIHIPPLVGGASLVAGLVLVFLGRKK